MMLNININETFINGKSVYAQSASFVFKYIGIKKSRIFSETVSKLTSIMKNKNGSKGSITSKYLIQIDFEMRTTNNLS